MADIQPVITLLTDFGLADHYAAAMKGVILSINPDARIVDISHEVQPQAVEEGAFMLEAVLPYFPKGTIHIAVVDPEVGGDRRGIVITTPDGFFVGPDNGVLSPALPDSARPRHSRSVIKHARLPAGYAAFSIDNPRYLREPVSATFHGRDVFAPAAAHLALGAPVESFGERLASIEALPPFRAVHRRDGVLVGEVIHIDRFGNLVTDIRADDLANGDVTVEIGRAVIHGLVRMYSESSDVAALIGSSGYLEIAAPLGNAAQLLEADLETLVTVRRVVVRLKRSQER